MSEKLSDFFTNKLKEDSSLASQVEKELPKKKTTKKKTVKKKKKVPVDRTRNKSELATEISDLAKSKNVPIESLRSIYFMLKVMDER